MICWFPVVTVEMLSLTGGDGMADWLVKGGPWLTIPGTEEHGQQDEYYGPVEASGHRSRLYP